jgi:hypothetical protein
MRTAGEAKLRIFVLFGTFIVTYCAANRGDDFNYPGWMRER